LKNSDLIKSITYNHINKSYNKNVIQILCPERAPLMAEIMPLENPDLIKIKSLPVMDS